MNTCRIHRLSNEDAAFIAQLLSEKLDAMRKDDAVSHDALTNANLLRRLFEDIQKDEPHRDESKGDVRKSTRKPKGKAAQPTE